MKKLLMATALVVGLTGLAQAAEYPPLDKCADTMVHVAAKVETIGGIITPIRDQSKVKALTDEVNNEEPITNYKFSEIAVITKRGEGMAYLVFVGAPDCVVQIVEIPIALARDLTGVDNT